MLVTKKTQSFILIIDLQVHCLTAQNGTLKIPKISLLPMISNQHSKRRKNVAQSLSKRYFSVKSQGSKTCTISKLEFNLQSCAGVVISVLVASTLVSATQFLKALYMGGMTLDSHGIRPVSSSAFNNQETSRNLSSTKYYHHRATINQTSTVSGLMHLPSNTTSYLTSKLD